MVESTYRNGSLNCIIFVSQLLLVSVYGLCTLGKEADVINFVSEFPFVEMMKTWANIVLSSESCCREHVLMWKSKGQCGRTT